MQRSIEQSHAPDVARQIVTLISADPTTFEAQKDDFIAARLQELEAQAPPLEGAIDSLGEDYSGFLTPDTEIKPSPIKRGFRLDDPEIYDIALKELRGLFNTTLQESPNTEPNEISFFKAALFATQAAQEQYFENIFPTAEQVRAHDQLVEDSMHHVSSIADFKNIGLCVQRSAVANNMLQFFGVPTTLKFGQLEIPGETNPEGHTFLLVKTSQGTTQLYDPKNPTLLHNEQGQLIGTRPRHPKVPEEVEATNGAMPVNLKVRVRTGDDWRIVNVPAIYHLNSNKEQLLATIEVLKKLALAGTIDPPL